MNMDYKKIGLPLAIGLGLFVTFSSGKISSILGSYHTAFGMTSIIIPLCGYFFATVPLIAAIMLITIVKSLTVGTLIALKIPTMTATLGWALTKQKTKKSELLNLLFAVIIPACCMIAFIMHPIAGLAPWYCSYWIIPMIIYGIAQFKKVHYFFTAIQITFVTHAVGSLVWLYSLPITAEQWNQLIAVVPIERTILALYTTLCLNILIWLKNKSSLWPKSITYLKGVAYGKFTQ